MDTLTFEPEFDHVYLIDGLGTISTEHRGLYAPDVAHDPTADVQIMGDGWAVLTGHTGQDRYNGAVMHASEQWGQWAISDLTSRVEEDGWVAFCIVEVRDEDFDYPDGDPIGWAVAWKVVR